jgi:RNA polymerase sigma-70 factor (ECF subfamily)
MGLWQATASRGQAMADEEAAFRHTYEANFEVVHRYVGARLDDRAEVADVVADVFAVAWRRRADRPAGTEELPWLLGVARRVLADHRRASTRRMRLVARVAAQPAAAPRSTDDDLAEQLEGAMAVLGERDREALRLVAWDDLSHADAARVLGCSLNALNVRVHRALRRLERALGPAVEK